MTVPVRGAESDDDDRGQAGSWGLIQLIVGLAVAVLVIALLMPIGIASLGSEGSESTTLVDQPQGETVAVSGQIESRVHTVADGATPQRVNLSVFVGEDSLRDTYNAGEPETIVVDEEEIGILLVEATGPNTATITYTYDERTGWSLGSSVIWGILDLIIVLIALIVLVGFGLRASHM